jgi:hypothetical protein
MNSKLLNLAKIGLLSVICFTSTVLAGNLDAPAAPDNVGSAMFTLQDICNRLDAGTTGSKRTGAFTEPTSTPASTECTIDAIMEKLPAEDASNAVAVSEVTTGKTYWSLKNGAWAVQTGTMDIKTLTSAGEAIASGIYSATTLSTIDPDLSSDNIKSGVTIFGIAGNSNVVDTTSGDAVANNILCDKKAWVDGVEITGNSSCI